MLASIFGAYEEPFFRRGSRSPKRQGQAFAFRRRYLLPAQVFSQHRLRRLPL